MVCLRLRVPETQQTLGAGGLGVSESNVGLVYLCRHREVCEFMA